VIGKDPLLLIIMLAENICHIILTRFNLPSGGRESKIRQSPNWLENRFQLFEKYCLPSVVNQSNSNFNWFIYFDKDTPEPFYSRAKQYEQQYPSVSLFWESDAPINKIRSHILKLARSNTAGTNTTLLTTRLDSDDALHNDFIDTLQKYAQQIDLGTSNRVLNYPDGLIINNGRTYAHHDESNPFASLLEPLSQAIQTVWQYPHTQLHKFGPIQQMYEAAMWLQVIHGNNVSNRTRGYRVSNHLLKSTFPALKLGLKVEKQWLIIAENIILLPFRHLKELGRSILKALFLLAK